MFCGCCLAADVPLLGRDFIALVPADCLCINFFFNNELEEVEELPYGYWLSIDFGCPAGNLMTQP